MEEYVCHNPGGGHFHSKVIGMLVVFFSRYKILILVFFGGFSGKFLENGRHFSQNSPQNCNLGIFRGFNKIKIWVFLGFSKKKISDEHTYHFTMEVPPPRIVTLLH